MRTWGIRQCPHPPRRRHPPSRIVRTGLKVYDLGSFLIERPFERGRQETGSVGGHGEGSYTEAIDDVEDPGVVGILEGDCVAGSGACTNGQ